MKLARIPWLIAGCLFMGVVPNAMAESADDPWPGLAKDLFQGRALLEDDTVALEAPKRAEDAAIVPVTMRFNAPGLRQATLVIDQNPMPMAGAFSIGEKAGVTFISTRVRVNSYTNVHAVGETADGALHAQVKFVKAAGGCSAPATKNEDEAHIGEMKYREYKSAEPGLREAQIMIRHPNSSGMQMDQLTHLYIPARYIDKVTVRQGDAVIFSMEGGISLSENPTFRFSYASNGAKTIRVEAHDSKGGSFSKEFPIGEGT
jgi:sulfur-oxidizing protein SoxY